MFWYITPQKKFFAFKGPVTSISTLLTATGQSLGPRCMGNKLPIKYLNITDKFLSFLRSILSDLRSNFLPTF